MALAIDAGVRVLCRCKWYREADQILTLVYSMVSGGSRLQDVNRLDEDAALNRSSRAGILKIRYWSEPRISDREIDADAKAGRRR